MSRVRPEAVGTDWIDDIGILYDYFLGGIAVVSLFTSPRQPHKARHVRWNGRPCGVSASIHWHRGGNEAVPTR